MAELKIKADSGGGTVSLKGPSTTTSNAAVQLTLPVDDGTANQYLKTDGSGALSWATVASVGGANALELNDGVKANFGTDDDLQIWHDDSNAYISNNKGAFVIQDSHAGANAVIIRKAGEVELLHNNVLACETSATGLAFPSGKGIDFSAQTATSATDSTTTSELLDHYEEGTWTPIPKINHVTTGITATVGGAYTRIGRQVHISFRINFSDKGSSGGQFTVHGLPFAENGQFIPGAGTGGGGAVFYQQGMAGLTTDGEMTFRVEASMLYMQCLNASNATVIPGGGELADDTHFYGHGMYYA